MGRRDGLRNGSIGGNLETFWEIGFFGAGQRRGTHVSIPKIGSRAGLFYFGGIWGFHADLRREFSWRNLDLMFFWVLGVGPRRGSEEGGHWCAFGGTLGQLREFCGLLTHYKVSVSYCTKMRKR
jgi:hypothetical protein